MDFRDYFQSIVKNCEVRITPGAEQGFLVERPSAGSATSPFLRADQIGDSIKDARAIHLNGVLETLESGKSLINACFDALPINGTLVITCTHQYLAEKKELPPSLQAPRRRRFLTPGLLLSEVEEALVPNTYRVRGCGDDDTGYNYALGREAEPTGTAEIRLVLEKISPPAWVLDDPEFKEDIVKIGSYGFFDYTRLPVREDAEKILIIKVDHRGDFLIALPVLQMIRAIKPQALITLVVSSWNVEVARELGYIDRIVVFDFFAENPSLAKDHVLPYEITELNNEMFDLAIDLRIDGDTRPLLKKVQARIKAGISEIDQNDFLDLKIKIPQINLPGQSEPEITVQLRKDGTCRPQTERRVDLKGSDLAEYDTAVDGLALQISSDCYIEIHCEVKNRTWFKKLRPEYRLFAIKDGAEIILQEGTMDTVRPRKRGHLRMKLPVGMFADNRDSRSLMVRLSVSAGGGTARVSLHKMSVVCDSAKALQSMATLTMEIHHHYLHNCEQLTALASVALMRLTRGTTSLNLLTTR